MAPPTLPFGGVDWRSVCRVAAVAIVLLNVCAFFFEVMAQVQQQPAPNGSARLARHLVYRPIAVPPTQTTHPPTPATAAALDASELSAACRNRRRKEDPECPIEPAELVLRPGATRLPKESDGTTCEQCGMGRFGPSCCRRGGSWFGLCGKDAPHSFREGFRACNELSCPVCGRVRAGNGDIDVNCCHGGGSWVGRCGPPAQGWAFTWKDGFRLCNNMSLTPEPGVLHDGPFVPLSIVAVEPQQQHADMGTTLHARPPLLLQPSESRLRIYYISLKPRPEAKARLAQLVGGRIEASRQAVVRGVRAAEALRTAGVPVQKVEAIFGEQASLEREFLSALGCTLSHLRTARRALSDGAEPALVLEEDAVLDLEPFWLAKRLDTLVSALPTEWQAVQLAMLATPKDWSQLRLGWQAAQQTWRTSALMLKADYFWGTAAYLLHPRGMRALVNRYAQTTGAIADLASNSSEVLSGWQLGTSNVRCVKADTCVLYPALAAQAVYVAVPPLFTTSERVRSSIEGHDEGQQKEVHLMSRMQSLDLAAEAHRESLLQHGGAPCGDASRTPQPSFEAGNDGHPPRYVLRHFGAASAVLELRPAGELALFSHVMGFTTCGTWHASGLSLQLVWTNRTELRFCLQKSSQGDYALANAANSTTASLTTDAVQLTTLSPSTSGSRAAAGTSLSFKFWLHDHSAMDWAALLACLPDWDRSMDSQNSAEVWLLRQLQQHPNRTSRWQDAKVAVLPLLLKTSLQAASCLNSTHRLRLQRAIDGMQAHPAYRRAQGHDHLVLFNYWDAWAAIGPRGSAARHAFENVTLGWHETHEAAWGMANHRHVGKCQVSLPYVEPPQCSALTEQALLKAKRPTPLFFAGAGTDFDTEGRDKCPNVYNHSIKVRRALFDLEGSVPGAVLRRMPHNLRHCNESSSCQSEFKRRTTEDMAGARFCAVATGDTPTTGRLYDAISCLCVPLLLADDLQLPFPATHPVPAASFGLRVPESQFLASPQSTVADVLARADLGELQKGLLRARRALSYRAAGSRVATLALREAWATCLRQDRSYARPPSQVAKC